MPPRLAPAELLCFTLAPLLYLWPMSSPSRRERSDDIDDLFYAADACRWASPPQHAAPSALISRALRVVDQGRTRRGAPSPAGVSAESREPPLLPRRRVATLLSRFDEASRRCRCWRWSRCPEVCCHRRDGRRGSRPRRDRFTPRGGYFIDDDEFADNARDGHWISASSASPRR